MKKEHESKFLAPGGAETFVEIIEYVAERKMPGFVDLIEGKKPQKDFYFDDKLGGTLYTYKKLLRARLKELGIEVTFKDEKDRGARKRAKGTFLRPEISEFISPDVLIKLIQGRTTLTSYDILIGMLLLEDVQLKNLKNVLVVANLRQNIELRRKKEKVIVSLDELTYIDPKSKREIPEYQVEIENVSASLDTMELVRTLFTSNYDLIPLTESKFQRGTRLMSRLAGISEHTFNSGIPAIVQRGKEKLQKKRVITILVTGGSATGKTEGATKQIKKALEREGIPVQSLDMDAYYKGIAFMQSIKSDNWDEPRAVDLPRFKKDLTKLLDGGTIEKPIYSFATGSHVGTESFGPCEGVILVDGIFALHPLIAPLGDIKIFVDAGMNGEIHARMTRRVIRDAMSGRTGQTPLQVLEQFFGTVQPMHEQHIDPQRFNADIILHNPHNPVKELRQSKKIEYQLKFKQKVAPEKIIVVGGTPLTPAIKQIDTIFTPRDGKLPQGVYWRARSDGTSITLSFKGPRRASGERLRPVDLEIDQEMLELFQKFFDTNQTIVKNRKLFFLEGVVVALDEFETHGSWVELQARSHRDAQKIARVKKLLGLKGKGVKQSYVEIFTKTAQTKRGQ